MNANITESILKPIQVDDIIRDGSRYRKAVIVKVIGDEGEPAEQVNECHLNQLQIFAKLRSMLEKDYPLSAIVPQAEQLFTNDGNEGIFYTLIVDDIMTIEAESQIDQKYNKIILRNEKFLNWLDDYITLKCPKIIHTAEDVEVLAGPYKLAKRGAKISLIKILYALHKLNLVQYYKGEAYPTLKEFMKDCGIFFGVDLTEYSSDMAQLKPQDDETLLKVFEKMQTSIINYARDNKEVD